KPATKRSREERRAYSLDHHCPCLAASARENVAKRERLLGSAQKGDRPSCPITVVRSEVAGSERDMLEIACEPKRRAEISLEGRIAEVDRMRDQENGPCHRLLPSPSRPEREGHHEHRRATNRHAHSRSRETERRGQSNGGRQTNRRDDRG